MQPKSEDKTVSLELQDNEELDLSVMNTSRKNENYPIIGKPHDFILLMNDDTVN